MNWVESPDSSNIARFRYISGEGTLEIEFLKGGIYQYFDVPEAIFEQLRVAGSKGQYFARNIKGTYRYARA